MGMEILKLLFVITAFQLLFFSMIAIALRPLRRYQYWMATFLIILFLDVMLVIGRWFYNFIPENNLYYLLAFLLEYSLCPAFLIFVIRVSDHKIRMRAKYFLFLLPYLIGFVFLYLPKPLWAKYGFHFHIILSINYYGQALYYAFLSFVIYKGFQLRMMDFVTQDYLQRLKWLKLVIISFTVLWSLAFVNNLVGLFFIVDHSKINFLADILYLVSINLMLFIGVVKPIGAEEKFLVNSVMITPETADKYASSNLSDNDKEQIIKKLEAAMGENGFYRTPNITLKILANGIKVQPKHLSQVINENYGQNFCEYINALRITDAKQQLLNPENNHKTILEIIYNTGFNSKSVFNTVFKKQTGVTPSAFRKKAR